MKFELDTGMQGGTELLLYRIRNSWSASPQRPVESCSAGFRTRRGKCSARSCVCGSCAGTLPWQQGALQLYRPSRSEPVLHDSAIDTMFGALHDTEA